MPQDYLYTLWHTVMTASVLTLLLITMITKFPKLNIFKRTDKRQLRYELYQDKREEWRWRLLAANNRIIADSSEGYQNKCDCLKGLHMVRGSGDAPVFYD